MQKQILIFERKHFCLEIFYNIVSADADEVYTFTSLIMKVKPW